MQPSAEFSAAGRTKSAALVGTGNEDLQSME